MPIIALMHMLIGVAFAYHAVKTGRAQYWLYILLFMPLVGPLAYVLIELVPELGSTRRAPRGLRNRRHHQSRSRVEAPP